MALPININDLLNKNKVESNRIEFKKGWNPIAVYHSICAFANDFDNIGGGYIIIGVEEENGIAKRPVCGVPTEQLDAIQRDIVKYNNLIEPYYAPRLSVEDIDGTQILVIWIPSGLDRPYAAPHDVTAKLKKLVYYIRYDVLLLDVVAGHGAQSHIGVLNLGLALLEVAGHEVVLTQCLAVYQLAELFEQVLLVVCLGSFGDLNLIVGDAVLCGDVDLDFGI